MSLHDRRLTSSLSRTLPDQIAGGLRNALRGDAGHAAVIDRTFAEQTGRTFGVLANYPGQRTGGTGGGVVGGSEDGHGGDTQGGGDVHGAGIVGEEHPAGGGELDKLAKAGAAGQTLRAGDTGSDSLAQSRLRRRPED